MVKNIRLINPNTTRVEGYFYSFDHQTDTMIQKADDGTLAFAYPLDTPIGQQVTDMEFDGESFWTMENIDGTPANGFRIRRWTIENFVMVLQQTFNFATDGNDIFESSSFAIERYESTLSAGASESTSVLQVAYDDDIFDLITPGTRMFVGPSTKVSPTDFSGQSQAVTVASTNPATKQISLTSPLSVGFLAGNKIIFSKNIWFFNQNFQTSTGVGALYKVNSLDGNILLRQQGGAFRDINASGFHEVSSFTGTFVEFNKPYLLFIRTNNLLFLNVNDSNLTVELSAVQNNLSADTTEVYPVFDLGIEGDTIFRLQLKFNINGTETTESTYNYQLATFRPFPIAIAITADPAILPADQGVSTSAIEATVTDQYGLPFVTSPPATIQFSTSGGGTGASLDNTGSIPLDSNGQAFNTYNTGNSAGLVTISAEVTI
jgi:hypothetical protein